MHPTTAFRLAVLIAGLPGCSKPPDTPSTGDAAGAAVDATDRDAQADDDRPGPPGVGLMYTVAQLDFVRAHRTQPPWSAAQAQLLADAEAALGRTPDPEQDFNVPGGYVDPQGQAAAKERLRQDAFAAYALALGYQLAETGAKRRAYATKAVEILDAWASVNQTISGADGDLVAMYAGITLLFAADLVMSFDGWPEARRSAFTYWASTVYWHSSDAIKQRVNNWGAWGTLGALTTAALLHNSTAVADEIQRLEGRIDNTIAANGELPEENKRTNSGMWYTYFALTAMTASARIARNVAAVDVFAYTSLDGRSLRLALDRDFFYAIHPEQWPYPLPDGIAGQLWRQLYPCADQVELPTVTGWPGPLFEIMSDVYQVPEWRDWVSASRPLRGYHAWLYVTLARQTP